MTVIDLSPCYALRRLTIGMQFDVTGEGVNALNALEPPVRSFKLPPSLREFALRLWFPADDLEHPEPQVENVLDRELLSVAERHHLEAIVVEYDTPAHESARDKYGVPQPNFRDDDTVKEATTEAEQLIEKGFPALRDANRLQSRLARTSHESEWF